MARPAIVSQGVVPAIEHVPHVEVDEKEYLDQLKKAVSEISYLYTQVQVACKNIKPVLTSIALPKNAFRSELDSKRNEKGNEYTSQLETIINGFNDYNTRLNSLGWVEKMELRRRELEIINFVKLDALNQMHEAVQVKRTASSEKLQEKIAVVGSSMDMIVDIVSNAAKVAAGIAFPVLAAIPQAVSSAVAPAEKKVGACETFANNINNIIRASNNENVKLLEEAKNITAERRELAKSEMETLVSMQSQIIGGNAEKKRLEIIISLLRMMISLAGEEIDERKRVGRKFKKVVRKRDAANRLLDHLESQQENLDHIFDAVTKFSAKKIEDFLPGVIKAYDEAKLILASANQLLLEKRAGNKVGFKANDKDKTLKNQSKEEIFAKRKAVIHEVKKLTHHYGIFKAAEKPKDEVKVLVDISDFLKKQLTKLVKSNSFSLLPEPQQNELFFRTVLRCITEKVVKYSNIPGLSKQSDGLTREEIRSQVIILMKECKAIFPACEKLDDAVLNEWIASQTRALTRVGEPAIPEKISHNYFPFFKPFRSIVNTAQGVLSGRPEMLAPVVNNALTGVVHAQQKNSGSFPQTEQSQQTQTRNNYQPEFFVQPLPLSLKKKDEEQAQSTHKLKRD